MIIDGEREHDARNEPLPVIAVIGGTGKLGSGLARRLAGKGRGVVIGSRSLEAAETAAANLGTGVSGMTNAAAAANADIVIVCVPFASQEETLTEIASVVRGKILVDTTVPLVPPKVSQVHLPAEGSAALRAKRLLGEQVRLVSAFHNISAVKLGSHDDPDCDVLVFSDDEEARRVIIGAIERIGLRGLHGGPLANSVAAEALTPILISMGKSHGIVGAGIKITGEPKRP